MARLEIPSIVVQSNSAPGSPIMERNLRAQRTLSKQAEFEELEEDESVTHKSSPSSSPGAAISMSCHCQGDDNTPSPASGNQTSDKHKTKEIRDDIQHQQQQRAGLSRANSVDTEDKSPPPPPRVRSHTKVKLLVRSHAMREETSPPPDPEAHHVPVLGPAPVQQQQQQPQTASTNSLSVGRPSSRHKLRHQGSSQGSMDSSSPCLSRDSSTEQYTDSTGVDLQQFIMDTLNRNQKDRILLLKIEQELVNLAKDNKRSHYKFPQMSSYQRMLVHRVAAYFGMDHNVDQTGNAVIVNRTKNTRLPDTKFRDHIREELLFPEEPRRSILKRDSSSFEDGCNFKSPERQFSSESRRSKSFEEREEEYEKARKRIFNREDGGSDPLHDCSRRSSQEDLRWPGEVQPWSSSDSDTSSRLRSNMLLHASDNSQLRPTRLPKVESFECRDTLKANSLRLSVSKSYSFGGYPVAVLSRGDSCTSTQSAGARLLTKQDSGSSMSSRLSPSSSGYKSQSQRSDTTTSATPSPTATPVSQLSISSSTQPQMSSHGALSPQHTLESSSREQNQTVMWAVTSMASVPPGSVLINPQTGQPYVNSDGSVYHYDPANPPKVVTDEDSEAGSGGYGSSSYHKNAGSCEQTQPPARQQNCQSQKSHATTTSISHSKTMCSTRVTTATSPSLPVSPPPVPLSSSQPHSNSALVNTQATSQIPTAPQQPVLTICHSSQCSYTSNAAAPPTEPVQPQQHLGTFPVASIPICPQLANPNNTVVNAQTPAYPQQQFMPALQHQQPEVMFGNHMPAAAQSQQPAPPQMVFAGYNMVAVPPAATGATAIAAGTAGYEQRHADGGSMAVSDLSSYFMGLGLVSSDQCGGGGVGGGGCGGGGAAGGGGGGGVRGNSGDSSGSQQQAQPSAAGGVITAPPTLHPHNYQSQPPAPAAYWQPQQQPNPIQHSQQQPPQQPTQQPLPMYYVPPALPAPPPPGPILNTSPPQQANSSNSNPSTPRYMAAYPPYQQVPTAAQLCHSTASSLPPAVSQETHQDRTHQSMGHNGGYVQNYPVMSYGAAVMTAPGNGECMPLYTQPSIHMLYTPTSINVNSLTSSSSSVATSALPGGGTLPYYHPPSTPTAHTQPVMGLNMGPPYMQPSQHGAALGAYRAPTPPQTPTQSQALCSMPAHPYIYLNGGTYTPVYNGGGPSGNAPTPGPYSQQPTGTPSTPGPSQYIPPAIISNLGLFRSNMQMMSSVRSSPPPRPPRDGLGSKPAYCRSPSVGSKDRGNGSHYDVVCGNDKSVTSVRYSSVPMFGLRIMPGDVRVMSQQPLSSSSPTLRMPFTLTSHPTSVPASHQPVHRMQHHPTYYPLGSQSSSSEVSVGRPPKPRKQRSKVTTTSPTNPVQNSLPPQASSTQPLSSAQVTLSTAVRGAGQEAGRVPMNDGSPSTQH